MKSQASFRYYAQLNDFLPSKMKQRELTHYFWGHPGIKDVIESQGIPHTEVDLILVNGISVQFDYLLKPNDRVSVYSMFKKIDIHPLNHLLPEPLRNPRFVLDTHLGKLASYLRLMGFDTLYWNETGDEVLAQVSAQEDRILLTRDIGLLKRSLVSKGYWVRNTGPRAQLIEIIRRFDLTEKINLFTRCSVCNGILKQVDINLIKDHVPIGVMEDGKEYFQCQRCEKVYWEGSHTDKLRKFMKDVVDETKSV